MTDQDGFQASPAPARPAAASPAPPAATGAASPILPAATGAASPTPPAAPEAAASSASTGSPSDGVSGAGPTRPKRKAALAPVLPTDPRIAEAQELLGNVDPEQVRKVLTLGKKAWPYTYKGTRDIAEVRAKLEPLAPGQKANGPDDRRYKVAGRLRAKRGSGGIAFLDIEGESAKIQAILDKGELGEAFDEAIHLLTEGDWVGVAGYGMRSKRGEASLGAEEVTLLAKCLVPFPDLRSADNPELRYGRPYVNLMQGPAERAVLLKRAAITSALRSTLEGSGFVEAAIPVLERVYGGANAKPFVTHSNAKDAQMFLRISHELALKKLLVGGIERVYHIGPAFRNEDIDTTHNPEFTLMECYAAFWDYNQMMALTEKLVRAAAKAALGTLTLARPDGTTIDFAAPFARVTMKEAIRLHSAGTPEAAKWLARAEGRLPPLDPTGSPGFDVDQLSDADLQGLVEQHQIQLRGGFARGLAIAKLFEHYAEPKLVQPTFIVDHPRETTPLCKATRKDPSLVERFELFILGREHANSYSELNDPVLQARLFKEQERMRAAGDEEAQPTDHDFIEALKLGMPPAGGLGIGVDRLVMTLLMIESIKQVLPFPQVK